MITRKQQIGQDSEFELEGPIENVIKHLQERKTEFEKAGFTEVSVEIVQEWGYYDDHWIEIHYHGKKHLTVKEFLEEDTKKKRKKK